MTFRIEITRVGKFSTSWSLTKLPDFGTYAYLSLCGPTLILRPSNFDRQNFGNFFSFSLLYPVSSSLSLFLVFFFFFFWGKLPPIFLHVTCHSPIFLISLSFSLLVFLFGLIPPNSFLLFALHHFIILIFLFLLFSPFDTWF